VNSGFFPNQAGFLKPLLIVSATVTTKSAILLEPQ
jgi:hypothetical protein